MLFILTLGNRLRNESDENPQWLLTRAKIGFLYQPLKVVMRAVTQNRRIFE